MIDDIISIYIPMSRCFSCMGMGHWVASAWSFFATTWCFACRTPRDTFQRKTTENPDIPSIVVSRFSCWFAMLCCYIIALFWLSDGVSVVIGARARLVWALHDLHVIKPLHIGQSDWHLMIDAHFAKAWASQQVALYSATHFFLKDPKGQGKKQTGCAIMLGHHLSDMTPQKAKSKIFSSQLQFFRLKICVSLWLGHIWSLWSWPQWTRLGFGSKYVAFRGR